VDPDIVEVSPASKLLCSLSKLPPNTVEESQLIVKPTVTRPIVMIQYDQDPRHKSASISSSRRRQLYTLSKDDFPLLLSEPGGVQPATRLQGDYCTAAKRALEKPKKQTAYIAKAFIKKPAQSEITCFPKMMQLPTEIRELIWEATMREARGALEELTEWVKREFGKMDRDVLNENTY